ncbi:MAG: hypothetical protein OQK73_12275 [Gammaproteobacteria bacterium]|nr:hypothetical protein [Gammaproteobacteria bacterium]
MLRTTFIVLLSLIVSSVFAVDYLRDKSEVSSLLSGQKLNGTYLRTQSAYSLDFHKEGRLVNQKGEQGRWWVNEQGQYCRQWETGRLKGHQTCLDLAREDKKIAIYSKGKRVAVGSLSPLK